MAKYNENISDSSLWITTTPTPASVTLPFHATEAGCFTAYEGYAVYREFHDSFLLIYTVNGSGMISTAGTDEELIAGKGMIIDCHKPHSYKILSEEWEFFWIHFNGCGTEALSEITALYGDHAATVEDKTTFERLLKRVMSSMQINDVISGIRLSSDIHRLFLILTTSMIEAENYRHRCEYADEIDLVTEFIKDNYRESITIDDMLDRVHLSKYHFIRLFKRIMGTTPYSYLTSYRINMAKRMLRLTDKPVAEIASECGFMDTSNFINHFKKSTGVKPMQYRRDFAGL